MEELHDKRVRDLSDEEWGKVYADIVTNRSVMAVSFWTEKNNAIPTDEEAFVQRAKENIPSVVPKLLQLCK